MSKLDSTRRDFLRAIVDDPDDDRVRERYARWLLARGEKVGRFILHGLAAARTGMVECPSVNLLHQKLRCGECQFCRHILRAQKLLDHGETPVHYDVNFPVAMIIRVARHPLFTVCHHSTLLVGLWRGFPEWLLYSPERATDAVPLVALYPIRDLYTTNGSGDVVHDKPYRPKSHIRRCGESSPPSRPPSSSGCR